MRARQRVWAGWGIVGLAAIGVAAACTSANTLTTTYGVIGPGTTSVSVDPNEFLGTVTCSNMPGTLRSYVATITDQSLPAGGSGVFVLPSSPPTDCSQSVYFEYVITGDGFSAEVDGYEEAPADLAPACSFQGLTAPPPPPAGSGLPAKDTCATDDDCTPIYGCGGACIVAPAAPNPEPLRGQPCGAAADAGADAGAVVCLCNYAAATGGRQMYYPLSYPDKTKQNTLVTPRWSIPSDKPCGFVHPGLKCACPSGTVCGLNGECYIQGQPFTDVSVSPCPPLAAQAEMTDGGAVTAIQVFPAAALGSLACLVSNGDAGATGTVTSFDIVPSDPALSPVTGLACLDPKASGGVVFEQGLVWGRSYVFTLNAYENGATTPTQTSQCFATAQLGVTVTAMCDPLAAPVDGG